MEYLNDKIKWTKKKSKLEIAIELMCIDYE